MLKGMDFVFFKGGKAEIGIEKTEADKVFDGLIDSKLKREFFNASSPPVQVVFDDFMIGKKLVTHMQFEEFINDTSYKTDAEKEGWGWVWENRWLKKNGVSWRKPFNDINDVYYAEHSSSVPVMQVSWNDSTAFTEWLSRIEKVELRMPFEHEWEILSGYAGFNTMHAPRIDGSILVNDGTVSFLQKIINEISNSEFQLGFVWEWTMDWYHGYSGSLPNKDFGEVYKTMRGGSLLSEDIQRTREFRFRRCPTARSPYYGFRLAYNI